MQMKLFGWTGVVMENQLWKTKQTQTWCFVPGLYLHGRTTNKAVIVQVQYTYIDVLNINSCNMKTKETTFTRGSQSISWFGAFHGCNYEHWCFTFITILDSSQWGRMCSRITIIPLCGESPNVISNVFMLPSDSICCCYRLIDRDVAVDSAPVT